MLVEERSKSLNVATELFPDSQIISVTGTLLVRVTLVVFICRSTGDHHNSFFSTLSEL